MGAGVFEIDKVVLVAIDIQGRLANMMHDPHYLRLVLGSIRVAQLLTIPVIVTEQAPDKIGPTVPEVKSLFIDFSPIIKQTFSCCDNPDFMNTLEKIGRKQVLVCGIESHVCVFQTVRDLCAKRYEVQLITDAVCSRTRHNAELGIRRSTQAGAALTSMEMFTTELLRSTEHPKFREIMALLKENK